MKKIASVIMIIFLSSSTMFVFISGVFAQDITTGLVGYWRFDEGSGVLAVDSSGNGNNGTLVSSPAWVNGKVGKALSFNGANEYVSITETTDLDPHTSNWTIAAWVNINQLTNSANSGDYGFVIVGKRQIVSDTSLTLLAFGGSSSTSQARFAFIFDGASQLAGAQSPLMNVFGWHYIAGVRRGGDLYVYVDGAEYGPNNFVQLGVDLTANTNVSSTTSIDMAHHGAWQSYYNGIIDDVRIYSRALNQQEIYLIMPEFPPFLILPIFMTLTLIVAIVSRRKHSKKLH